MILQWRKKTKRGNPNSYGVLSSMHVLFLCNKKTISLVYRYNPSVLAATPKTSVSTVEDASALEPSTTPSK